MFDFFSRGRSGTSKAQDVKPVSAVEPAQAVPIRHDKQREMIRLALNGVLRRHGIPSQWIGCEIMPMARPGATDVMLTQLVVLKWHDGLVRYAPELQKQFFNEIHLFDSDALAADYLFVWKFTPECGYPHGLLPKADFWSTPPEAADHPQGLFTTAASAASAAAPAAPKFDLPVSDRDYDDGASGFAATQINNIDGGASGFAATQINTNQ